jgi:two-component system cell cycle response regulator DivK
MEQRMDDLKVLYIEDNLDNMRLVERALQSRGYSFIWGENGRRGLELAASERPGVILLDINLPDIDGYEVARRLREDKTMLQTPIIAITANALKADAEKALAAGCDVYMAKPINIRELWARVEAFLPSQFGSGNDQTWDRD